MRHAVKSPKEHAICVEFPLHGLPFCRPRLQTTACLGYSPVCICQSYSCWPEVCERSYGDKENREKSMFSPLDSLYNSDRFEMKKSWPQAVAAVLAQMMRKIVSQLM
ncbi:unnamed protein product, partial [Sphacelaria rigidula]